MNFDPLAYIIHLEEMLSMQEKEFGTECVTL